MKRYNSEDYFSVINKNTGKKIADCAQQEDALLMVSFDPQNRVITTNKFLMGQVVDVVMPKALPTSEVVFAGNYEGPLYAPGPRFTKTSSNQTPRGTTRTIQVLI
jgi:hypothetical protein